MPPWLRRPILEPPKPLSPLLLPRRSRGIGCPILPGVMPVMTYAGFKRMTSFCKTAVPQHIADALEAIKGSEEAVKVRMRAASLTDRLGT